MAHVIANKTAKILIVEPNQGRRGMLAEGFRNLGFTGLTSVATLKDAYGVIEGESRPPDWIITSLLEDQPVNAFHLLSMITETESLRGCRVSLIADEEQAFCLSKAFALGLYSNHPRFPDTASQLVALSDLFVRGEEQGWDDCLIAAHYLREHLKERNRLDDLERLEMRLLALFPDRPALGVKLAEALFLSQRLDSAQRVLDRLPPLTGEAQAEAAGIAERIQNALGADGDLSGLAKALQIGMCLVVDPDEAARKTTKDALQQLGVTAIVEASNGEEAFNLLEKGLTPDLIVQEWRLPKLSGDLFVQRVRHRGPASLLVIVYSSLVKANDRLLLREMGVTDVVTKPQAPIRLAQSFASILKEERRPKTVQALERQIRTALAKRELNVAKRLLDDLTNAAGKDAALIRTALAADLAFHSGDLQQASDLATRVLHIGGEDVMALNLLGKIQMKLGRFDAATKYFDRAQKLSPNNVGRLATLAEAQASADQTDKATATLGKAKALDAGHTLVVEAEVKVALASGDVEGAKAAMEKDGATPGVVAFVNNRGVALVNQGRVKESVEQYRTALNALPKGSNGARPLITYNLALALVRLGDVKGAQDALAKVAIPAERELAAKLKSLATRITKAVATGAPLVLNLKPEALPEAREPAAHESEGKVFPTADLRPGTLCCHLVYDDQDVDPRVAKLLPTGTSYRARKALKKGSLAS